jgi:hypothetical protein
MLRPVLPAGGVSLPGPAEYLNGLEVGKEWAAALIGTCCFSPKSYQFNASSKLIPFIPTPTLLHQGEGS